MANEDERIDPTEKKTSEIINNAKLENDGKKDGKA